MEIDSELRSKETWLISEDGLWDISFGIIFFGLGINHLIETSTLDYQFDNDGLFLRGHGWQGSDHKAKDGIFFYR